MSKRESYPPRSASIGRVQGHKLNVTPEPLSAHPLLSPPPQSFDVPIPASSAPRYVPYTPRQRAVPPPTTTTTPSHSTNQSQSITQGQGAATSKLQLMNLKAAAQALGLDTGSTGWAMLEKLSGFGSGAGDDDEGEWAEIGSAIATGKTTLLLPLDPIPPHDRDRDRIITPEFVKDHIVLCGEPPSSASTSVSTAGVVTLSGLRGVIISDGASESLIFRSSIHPSSKTFHALLDPNTRSSTLAKLPPLPSLPSSQSSSSSASNPNSSPPTSSSSNSSTTQYPAYALPTHTHTLPLPPRPPPNPNTTKPPLPPRPGVNPLTHPNANVNATASANSLSTTISPTPSSGTGRISSGFASLFGVKPSTPPPLAHLPASSSVSSSPAATFVSGASTSQGLGIGSGSGGDVPESDVTPLMTSTPIEIPAYAISRRIIRDEVGKAIGKAIKEEINAALVGGSGVGSAAGAAAPGWVAERVIGFVEDLFPLVKADRVGKGRNLGVGMTLVAGKGAGKSKGAFAAMENGAKLQGGAGGGGAGGGGGKYVVNMLGATVEEMSERFQEFYEGLEGDLRAVSGGRKKVDGVDEKGGVTDKNAEREKQGEENEARVREIMEVVERVACELFYDRLFLQPFSDDPTHDEALSSRVAALNMLDLGLEHLDVDVSGVASEGVGVVVRACGETLSQLDVACRSPADKAAILVAAHKVVVDGLSKLPPIKFKSDATSPDQKIHKTLSSPEKKKADLPPSAYSPLPSGPVEAVDAPTLASPTTLVSSPISDVAVSDPHAMPVDNTSAPKQAPSKPSLIALDPSPSSPLLTISPPATATPVSGDILLPLIIFSVVKANPPHLVSHLLYTQRFRNKHVGGEESYCMINLMAVAEFLENVDLGALGLGDSEKKVISTADLTPIPLVRTPDSPAFPQLPSLRGRVEQQVDAIAGSANKVLLGVVDTSFGMLRSLLPLPGSTPQAPADPSQQSEVGSSSAPWNAVRPGFGLLRRESGFSIASLAASLPGSKDRNKSILGNGEEAGQQLVSVSRPGSVKSEVMNEDDETSDSEGRTEDDTGDDEDGEEDQEEMEAGTSHDTRSIKSFESMMSGSARERKEAHARKSLSDRLAHMPGLSRLSQSDAHKGSPPASQRTSLLPPVPTNRFDTPLSSRPQSPISLRLAPPNRRFVECHEDDLKVSEVSELLREYKRLVEGVRAIGGFDE